MVQTQHKLDGISILRTFAMISIMLYHIGYGHYYLTQLNPSAGVFLFFCISAFLVMYTTETKTPSSFLKRRLIRIVPLYLILTIFTFIASKFIRGFGQDNISIAALMKSILFIPYFRSGLKSDLTVRPIVGPAWTLYFDVWFAFIFSISMKVNHKHRGIIAAFLCIALCILGEFLPRDLPLTILLRTRFLLSFASGILVFYVWNAFFLNKTPAFPVFWGIAAILLLIYFYLVARNIFVQVMVSSLILFCVLISTYQKPVPKIFTLFSQLSFSFYLLHYYVILIVGKFIDFTEFNVYTVLGTFLVLFVTLFISFFSNLIIEKKLSNALNRL